MVSRWLVHRPNKGVFKHDYTVDSNNVETFQVGYWNWVFVKDMAMKSGI